MSEEMETRRGPGRPRTVTLGEGNQAAKPAPTTPVAEQSVSVNGRQRKARNVFGQTRQKLSYEARQGYHRHWFNDNSSRIGDAKTAGYEHVLGHDGKPVSKTVGTAEGGGPLVAFLMEIPQEWYDEDMAEQQRAIDEKEAQIKRGKVDDKPDEHTYVPTRNANGMTASIRRGN